MSRNINLTATSPIQTFSEPLSLQEARAYLNLSEDFVEDDDQIIDHIRTARVHMEGEEDLDLVRKQSDLTLDSFWDEGPARSFAGFPISAISLRRPLVSVDLVRY